MLTVRVARAGGRPHNAVIGRWAERVVSIAHGAHSRAYEIQNKPFRRLVEAYTQPAATLTDLQSNNEREDTMRSSSIFAAVLVLLVVGLALPSPSAAQEWSAQQQEVWQNVQTYWGLYAKEDVEGHMAYLHDDFLGWVSGQPFPTNKADRKASMMRNIETSENVLYTLKPMGIKVHGDIAIVHYFFTSTDLDAEGKQTTTSGHWTDIVMRQENRWVMIGDAGGTVSQN
jgi:ketosteroid isomerase-like protein